MAIAIKDGYANSDVASKTYITPNYNRPAIIAKGSATVDGDLSDWSGTTWAPLNTTYDIYQSTEEALNADIAEAYYAARWQAGRVYVAVKVKDMSHYFKDAYTDWNARDAVEIYLHTDNMNDITYSNCTTAQEYVMGIMSSDHTKVWTALGNSSMYPNRIIPIPSDGTYDSVGKTAGKLDGDWIYYEIEVTPFTYFGYVTGEASTITTLEAGDIIGLDVCVAGHSSSAYTGMKSENSMTGKSVNWQNFGLHVLVIPGDANCDGAVDVGDLGILAANYGGSSKAWNQGDFNGDGIVDVGDLGILAANYGTGSQSGADFNADYAKVFGTDVKSVTSDDSTTDDTDSTICSSLGLSLVAGLVLMSLMLVKLEE
jgi:hypothetical protein